MFSAIKAKLAIFGAGIMAIMAMVIKYLSAKNDKLEEEIETFEKKDEINNAIDKAEIENAEISRKERANIDDTKWKDKI